MTRNLWFCIALSIFLLAVSAVITGRAGGSPAAIAIYLGVRAVVFIAAAYSFMRFAARRRFQALALVGLIAFVDQVPIKSWLMIREMRAQPAEWQGIAESTVIFGIATSYLYFLPIVLIMGFLGTTLASAPSVSSPSA